MKSNFKKIAFPPLAGSAIGVIGDSLKTRFSVVRKVLYTFLHHKVFIFFLILCLLPLKLLAAEPAPFGDSSVSISMDFQDANLKDVVKIFSIQSGLNFIASEAVQDRMITLFLDKVPIKEVMDKLFKANNLTYELDKEAKIFIVKDWGKPELETVTRVYCLKYRSVPSAKLEKEKSSLLSKAGGGAAGGGAAGGGAAGGGAAGGGAAGGGAAGGGAAGGGAAGRGAAGGTDIVAAIGQVLSPIGKIGEDISTNSLIITDIPSRFSEIERVIASLDVPQLQIMLDVEILDVSKNVIDKLGFEFGNNPFTLLYPNAYKHGLRFIGNVALRGADAVTSSSAGALVLGNVYGQVLDFLRTQTDTKYLARPRLLTLNNETAEISITKDEVVGREDTVTNATTGGSTITSVFKRATDLKLTPEGIGIFLRVTPQINPDTNEIIMVINPKSSVTSQSPLSITQATATQGINLQSDTEIRTTKSIVKVKNGETVIIGGLIHNDKQVVIKKVPLLGDIPFIGAFFRHKYQSKGIERELLVFITPHIVKDTNVEFAQAKKTSLLTKGQIAVSPSERQLAIDASLNSFEKVK